MQHTLPQFSKIDPANIEATIDRQLQENRQKIETLLSQTSYTWKNLLQPLEDLDIQLQKLWSPIRHMNAVVSTEALRSAHNACLPKLSAYETEIGQNELLFKAIQSIKDGPDHAHLDTAQKKIIDNLLRDFRLSGIALTTENKKRFSDLKQRLSQLSTQFEENVLDATDSWSLHITDEARLAGLPSHTIEAAKDAAQNKNQQGWLFGLEFPTYYAIITYADDASLRKTFYTAFSTRASDQAPNAERWDNSAVIDEILALQHELANLLDFNNYAELSLATKMAESTDEVFKFLNDLLTASRKTAESDFNALKAFAKSEYDVSSLDAWDIPYYSEKLKQAKYEISDEMLRPYFPEDTVVQGLFNIVNKLYGIQIKEEKNIDVWHKQVRFFSIYDSNNQLRGQFYLDLYARAKKRGGAWMDECHSRHKGADGIVETPVAFLTCNFTPPLKNTPALLNHIEVITLFHEFGHGLHHMLTQIDYASVSGITGVEWDAVELPSQFMENWCWEKEGLALTAKHYKTGESLPDELFNKLTASKNFHAGLQMARQLEFSLFDFHLHADFDPKQGAKVQETIDTVRAKTAVTPIPAFNRFQHSFSHIFGGGYAAGYYSYKWAEVLSSDAFSKFEETGIFNAETGSAFLEHVLEMGGSRDAMESFVAFRGRKPTIDALLRHTGIE